MQDYNNRMKEEIRLRLENDSWDFTIAGMVLNEKRARKEKGIFRGYLTSLATASVFLVLFIFNVYSYLNTGAESTSYNSLLYSYSSETSETYSINTEETDLIINEVFPMR